MHAVRWISTIATALPALAVDMQRRIRDVLEERDGALLVITDDRNGELLRLTPGS